MASFRKMLVAGTAIAAGLGWASQSVLAEPGDQIVAITGATIFDATGKEPFRGTVILRGGRIGLQQQQRGVQFGQHFVVQRAARAQFERL